MTTARLNKIIHRKVGKLESEKIIDDYKKWLLATPKTQYRRLETDSPKSSPGDYKPMFSPRLRHYVEISDDITDGSRRKFAWA